MTIRTTTDFTCISACGKDWRDVSRQVLACLEKTKSNYSLGILYATEELAEDMGSILTLFRSVSNIDKWTGTIATTICANGKVFKNRPAITVMLAQLEESEFCIFPPAELDLTHTKVILDPWLKDKEAVLGLVHGNALSNKEPSLILQELTQITEAYLVGGMSSSTRHDLQIAEDLVSGGVSGVLFSKDIPVVTGLTQGCLPIGDVHRVTKADGHIVTELDGQKAFDIFSQDLHQFARKKAEKNPEGLNKYSSSDRKNLSKGEIHVAFPVTGSDMKDYMVQDLAGIEPEEGWLAITSQVYSGDTLLFVHRDNETIRSDLSRMLLNIRKRVTHDWGSFSPKAAIYISCINRTKQGFGFSAEEEMTLVQEIIGDIPLAGFYAKGEIANGRLYGYTGILTLFL